MLNVIQSYAQLPNRGCGTVAPDDQYNALFQQKVLDYLNQSTSANRTQSTVQIPVIIHVIHGGEVIGVFPNIDQQQINSQIKVLNDDYAGIGFNSGNYPGNAFQTYATNSEIPVTSKDGAGRIGISNTGITFCLALKDSIGNFLPEPGIERMNWSSISGASSPTTYTDITSFMNLINSVIKPATIWSPDKYLNIWISDINPSVGLLGLSMYPPLSGLPGIPGAGTSTTDGLWCWTKSFGSKAIFSTGIYAPSYDYGRTATHELSHYFGVRHPWGDGSCLTDYCNDTPAQLDPNYNPQTYPYLPDNCTSLTPPTGPEGIMFMNFADYTPDAGMYMFTDEQRIRMQTAMINSPYRKLLGTHGFCNAAPPPVAYFSVSSLTICQGQSISLTDLSTPTGSIVSWNYNCPAATPSNSTFQNPTFTFNSPGTHTITLNVTSTDALSASITRTIQVNPKPVINASHTPLLPICAGKTATINITGAVNYTTNPGNITVPSFTVSPVNTTTYNIVGVSPQGCFGYTLDTIKVNPKPIILSNVNSNTLCVGSSITFSNSGASSYTLNPTATNGSIINISPPIAGTTIFTISGTNSFGCINTKTISITAYSLPNVSITPSSTTICSWKSVILTASGANTYTWSGSGSTIASITVFPASPTTYSLIGTDVYGCQNSALSNVNVVSTPVVSINSPSTNVCFGYTMALTANGADNYLWFNGTTANTTTLQPFSNITYSVIGTNEGTCSDTAFLPITILPLPSVSSSVNNNLVCVGQSVNLMASGSANTYTWMPGFLQGPNQMVQIFTPTTYTVYGEGSNGCAFFSTTFVNVHSTTSIIPVATPSSVCLGDSAILSVIGGYVPFWSSNAIPNTSMVTPMTNTSYTVNASDFNGCVSDIVFYVAINADCDVIVYNGFTPNGDGVNDFWIIDNIEKHPNNNVYIYNRWGNKIFETSQYNNTSNNWDGKLNGKAVTPGTYFYIIVDDNEKFLKKGWIEITN